MARKTTTIALAIGAALVSVIGTRASAQVVAARVYVGTPRVYVATPPLYLATAPVYVTYSPGPPPGPGYYWDARVRRWCYRRDWVAAFEAAHARRVWGERHWDRAWDRDRHDGGRDFRRDRDDRGWRR
jgi:hypothetical protein